MKITKRVSISLLLAGTALATTGLAFAQPAAERLCEGKGEGKSGKGHGKGAHFKKADTNGDGFLTQAEVGDERWARLKVADANGDSKVTKEELMQARKDGKMPRKNKA